jgi:hypothetical protein
MMLSDSDRDVFAAMADVIIPAWERMPSAKSVGVHRSLLDAVLLARPDLVDGVTSAIATCRDRAPSEGVNQLFRSDKAAFDAFTLAATGAYYMDPTVRELLGYPGQVSPPYDPMETPDYLTDGLLERVTRRGAIYKSTPR